MKKEMLQQIERESKYHPYNETRKLFEDILKHYTSNNMKDRQELLTILMEECAEVSVEASKIIRFGSETFGEVYALEKEIGDLMCMIELLEEYNLISLKEVKKHVKLKREKLKKWSNLNV